nr:probable histidine kinase 5 isoform X1 [Physcomitrium patens]XP_024402957.1 probable histidine kinase 5 isoform X1 [Physcomitrium patens]XP_024402958.1 probable histidine kinase 5 isoform X1 [Physcomitrium patens]XP_024402959.1 probable histidine kinase 5 isoform X1 [Physcomitrium patens]|eukprot:XP_024402956.1 probable histidine kinase 5 isoform X1 [Physcomitrella patens]
MELESVPFNLRKQVDSVFTLFDDKLHQKKLEVFMLVHEPVPNLILVNLVNNALKFTKEGSILVSVRVMDPYSEKDHNGSSSEPVGLVSSDPKAKGSIQLSQVLPNASYGLDSSKVLRGGVFRRDETDLARGNTAPRLSMHSGDEGNTREAVEAWRAWKLTTMSGIGLPRHLQDRLFQPFSQADSSTSREYGGTGIGLSICQKLIYLMKGALIVKSNSGEGSVFEFTLPLSVPETTDGNLCSCVKTSIEEMTKLKGTRVALVDNNDVRQEVTASYLRCLGIDVVKFSEDASSTLNFLLKDQNPKVHAVMVDLKGLLHESAVELASSIRQVLGFKTLPVLALSTGLRPANEKELKGAGFPHIINKPLRYNTLASVLLETVGVPARAPMKKMNVDSKMMSGKRLLVMDNNMVNRRVASSMLFRNGATVKIVNCGLDAVTAVQNV